jgi:hypothetical protein
MGMYMFINESERKRMKTIEDKEINEVFQEALKYCPSLLIQQNNTLKRVKRFLSSKIVESASFTVYHDEPAYDGSAYQARYQICGSGDRSIVFAYLYGIINGGLAEQRKLNQK